MLKYRVIINPYARHEETARLVPAIHELFSDSTTDAEAEFIVTKAPGHAIALAAASPAREVETVVAVGGDGTVHEVVEGLMRLDDTQRPTLGIIPTGSGNDTALGFGLPVGLGLAGATALSGSARNFDVGQVNERYFAGSFSVGLDALVVSKTIEYKTTHGWSGARLYYSALIYVVTHELRPIQLEISYDDEPSLLANVLLTCVTNGRSYGGGIPINPAARPDDGLLSLSWVDNLSIPATLARLPLIVRGQHTKLKIYHPRQVRCASIRARDNSDLIAQTDGELFTATEFHVRVLPAALRVLV
jgi:YegS/Rv2252/BmrU family lipid kinase